MDSNYYVTGERRKGDDLHHSTICVSHIPNPFNFRDYYVKLINVRGKYVAKFNFVSVSVSIGCLPATAEVEPMVFAVIDITRRTCLW